VLKEAEPVMALVVVVAVFVHVSAVLGQSMATHQKLLTFPEDYLRSTAFESLAVWILPPKIQLLADCLDNSMF
jgi:hypothetical protein